MLTAAQYRRVFAEPLRSSNAYFTLLAKSNGEAYSRLGLAIAKKQLRRAVDRNRIKRLVREWFRTHLQGDEAKTFDLVVLTRTAAKQTDNAELYAALHSALAKLQRQL